MKSIKLFLVLLSIGILISCEKEKINLENEVSDFSITGYAQKGQFIKGSNIVAYALDKKLQATGESFPTIINDNLGSFSISSKIKSPFIELKAEGYYFVENKGNTSNAPIYLNALVSSKQEKVNINLLTTIISGRIKKLVNQGLTFDSAKVQAEKEAIKIFSKLSDDISSSFEEMNISGESNSDALLLALSCFIQEGRTAGEVQKLIFDISSEFEENGILSDDLINEIFQNHPYPPYITMHMINFYKNNKIDDFKIPSFYAMLNKEFSKGFYKIGGFGAPPTECYDLVDSKAQSKEFYAISFEDFILQSNVDWITAESEEISPNLHSIKINILSNEKIEGRDGYLLVKSKANDEILYTDKTHQNGSGQNLVINYNLEGLDSININNKNYNILYDSVLYQYYVDLPINDEGYGISTMPEMVVTGNNGDVLCATFTYPSEVEECDDEVEKAYNNDYYNYVSNVPYYSAYKYRSDYLESFEFNVACGLFTIYFDCFDNSVNMENMAKIELETNSDGFLAGKVTKCMYPEYSEYEPTYVVPETEYQNQSNKLTIYNITRDNKISFWFHPQVITNLKLTAYDDYGAQLFQIEDNSYNDCSEKEHYQINYYIDKK